MAEIPTATVKIKTNNNARKRLLVQPSINLLMSLKRNLFIVLNSARVFRWSWLHGWFLWNYAPGKDKSAEMLRTVFSLWRLVRFAWFERISARISFVPRLLLLSAVRFLIIKFCRCNLSSSSFTVFHSRRKTVCINADTVYHISRVHRNHFIYSVFRQHF